jgi:hypothetical protein
VAVDSLVRAVIASALGAIEPGLVASSYARRTWPDDRGIELVLREASPPASTTSTGALQSIALALLGALVPLSAAADLFSRALSLSFDRAAPDLRARHHAAQLRVCGRRLGDSAAPCAHEPGRDAEAI